MKTDTPSARSARRSAGLQSILNLVLVLAILLMVNYLGFKYYTHRDLSASQFYTLSPKTVDLLKSLDAPVTIYTFLDEKNPGQADQVATLLKEYQRVGGKNIEVEKIDTNFNFARAQDLYKKLHFDANDHLLIFEYKDAPPRFVKQADLYEINPMTQQPGPFKGEQLISSAITSLIEGKISHVYFTVGHGEHALQDSTSQEGYGAIAGALKSENVQMDNLSLAQKGEVPEGTDAVVIAGPSISFSQIEVEALDRYLAANGKLFILLDPYVVSGLDDLLKKYGLKFEDDLVLYRSGNIVTETGGLTTFPMAYIYQGGFSAQPITAKFAQANVQMILQNVRTISLPPDATGQPNPKAQFLLQTDGDAWGWINHSATMPADLKNLTYNKITDISGPVIIAAQYDGGTMTDPKTNTTVTGTRIVAIGSSRFVENDTYDGAVGANFFTNSLDWLVKKNAILDISPKTPQEYGLSLSPMQFHTVVWCALFFIPGAALALGVLTWFSRRK